MYNLILIIATLSLFLIKKIKGHWLSGLVGVPVHLDGDAVDLVRHTFRLDEVAVDLVKTAFDLVELPLDFVELSVR